MSEVILAGAGCGGLQQCTLEVLQAIAKAQIIFYDDLLDPALLSINRKAVKIYTGKRLNKACRKQEEITKLLIEAAEKYDAVLRLKGGDPYVFGRGYEEKTALEAAGICCRVLPGLSSCIAVPERCQIPVTARGQSSSFLVTTAHTKEHRLFDQPASLLAQYSGTLIILMGMSRLQQISDTLIAAGKDPEIPAAICLSENIVSSTCIQTTLRSLPRFTEQCRSVPGVLVIGQTAAMAGENGRKPLTYGICSTSDFFNSLIAEKNSPKIDLKQIVQMKISILPVSGLRKKIARSRWLVFTSMHGAEVFLKHLAEDKIDLRSLQEKKIACIGRKTAAVFEKKGIYPDFLPSESTTETLFSQIAAAAGPGETILLFRSAQAPENEGAFFERGRWQRINLYSLVPELHDLDENLSGIVFGSASAVRSFYTAYPDCSLPAFSLGPVTSDELRKYTAGEIIQAKAISTASLMEALEARE